MTSELQKRLTPLQVEKLKKANIHTLYQLITYFPYKLDLIKPFHLSDRQVGQKYLLNGFIVRFEIVSRGVKFIKLDVSGSDNIQLYLFNSAPYIMKLLHQKSEFQFIILNKNGFWTIEKFAEKKELNSKKIFVLGRAKLKEYYIPRYERILALTDGTLQSIHQRLQPLDYLLNLEGLVPTNENSLMSQQINLALIHHPLGTTSYQQTAKQFTSLQVFLRVALLKQINLMNQKKLGVATNLDLEYIKSVSDSLPYTLSPTQKSTIWDLIQDLSN
jgi:ATP-dependent DNA helicase RecG